MLLDRPVKKLTAIPQDIIDRFANLANTVDWTAGELTRNGDPLPSRTIQIPFNRRKEPYQEITAQVKKIQEQFFIELGPWLEQHFPEHILFKGEINYLSPGMALPFHIDPCWFHEHSSRIHIPIFTNPQAFWVTPTKLVHMSVGSVYEVNNRELHTFWNRGPDSRLHIVIDMIKKNLYQEAVEQDIDVNKFTINTVLTDAEEYLQQNQWPEPVLL